MSNLSSEIEYDLIKTKQIMRSKQQSVSSTKRSFQILKNSNQEEYIQYMLNKQEKYLQDSTIKEEYRDYKYRWIIVLVFSLLSISNAMTWIDTAPITDQLQNYYEVKNLQINMISLVYFITYIPINFIAQYVIDYSGTKRGLIIGAILTAIGSTIKIFINNWFIFALIGNIIAGIGQPFILNSTAKIAATWFKPENRLIATTLMSVSNSIGIGLGFLISSAFVSDKIIEQNQGKKEIKNLMFYSNIFVVTSSLILIIFIKNKPPTPPSLAANTKKESYLKSFKICLSNKDFILLTFFFGLSIGSISTLATIVQQVLQPFNYKSDESGLIGALLILSGMIGSGFYGFMHDKYQNYKLLLIVGNVVQLFSWGLFIVFLYFQQKNLVYLCSVMLGFNIFPILPLGFELGCELTFPVGEAFSTGILMTGSQIVGIIQVLALNQFLEQNKQTCSYIILVIFGFIAIINLVLISLMKQKLSRGVQEVIESYKE